MQVNHRGSQEMHELHVRIEELEAENAKLISDLRNAIWTDSEHCKLLEVENARLRADLASYERTAQIIATLPPESDTQKLAAFAREIIEPAFDGHDVDGGSIQSLAVHYGLLRETQYDPKVHGASFAEPGAEWFEYAGPLASR